MRINELHLRLVIFGLALVGCCADFVQARVILISIDGLRPDAIDAADTPNLDSLIATGAYSPLATCDIPTATLPNHTTMLTGLTVTQHGVRFNVEVPGKIEFRTLHDECADAGLKTGFYASKSKFGFLAHEESTEVFELRGTVPELVDLLIERMVLDPLDFIFFHSREPDSTGHATGWMSPEYLAAVEMVDGQIGRILDALVETGLNDTRLIITADHGGQGPTHFLNVPEVRLIPWLAWGPGIASGRTLCLPPTQQDTPATVLSLLGVPVPESYAGSPVVEALASTTQTDCQAPFPFLGLPCVVFMIPVIGSVFFGLIWARSRRRPGLVHATPLRTE